MRWPFARACCDSRLLPRFPTRHYPPGCDGCVHQSIGTWSRCIDVLITPSAFVRNTYLEAGWPCEKLFVKYNTVAEAPYNSRKRRSGFLCVARLSREKGVDVLLEAWARAFPDGGEGLQIVGSGNQEKQLKKAADGIAGISFRGQLPTTLVMELLSKCRAAIVPSLWHEPFGRTVVEAFSVQTPVIASRMGALPELIADGRNGVLTEAGSPQSLASALEAISSSDSLANTLGRHARASYETQFSPEATTKRLIGLYALAVDRSSTPGGEYSRHSEPRMIVAVRRLTPWLGALCASCLIGTLTAFSSQLAFVGTLHDSGSWCSSGTRHLLGHRRTRRCVDLSRPCDRRRPAVRSNFR